MVGVSHVGIIGAGSWGTALAQLVSAHCARVTIVARSPEIVTHIKEKRINPKYLTSVTLAANITAANKLDAIQDCSVIILAVPTSAIRNTAILLKEQALPANTSLVSVAKGIERGTGLRMSEIIKDVLPQNPVAALSGPNHAEEVSLSLPTCTVIGCEDSTVAQQLQPLFKSTMFRTYTSDDLCGIEWGGAMKNVFAIAAGICQGLKLGDNAAAALVTRALAEMTRMGVACGAREHTFAGLSGVGDLITTCYSPHSRNHQIGLALAKGLSVREAEHQLGMVAEGVRNTQSIYEQALAKGVEVPLTEAVYSVLYKGTSPASAIQALFTRDLKAESEK